MYPAPPRKRRIAKARMPVEKLVKPGLQNLVFGSIEEPLETSQDGPGGREIQAPQGASERRKAREASDRKFEGGFERNCHKNSKTMLTLRPVPLK